MFKPGFAWFRPGCVLHVQAVPPPPRQAAVPPAAQCSCMLVHLPPCAVCARRPDVSSSGGSWVLVQERVSVHHPWLFPGTIWDAVRSERGAARLCCGRELVGCAGSHPLALPAWGHGASPLPRRTGSRAEGMTRVLAHPCFAPLRHVSWAWRVPCVMSSFPPPSFCQTLHALAPSPAASPQTVMLPRGCWGALDVPGGVCQATAPSAKGTAGSEHLLVVHLMLRGSGWGLKGLAMWPWPCLSFP